MYKDNPLDPKLTRGRCSYVGLGYKDSNWKSIKMVIVDRSQFHQTMANSEWRNAHNRQKMVDSQFANFFVVSISSINFQKADFRQM